MNERRKFIDKRLCNSSCLLAHNAKVFEDFVFDVTVFGRQSFIEFSFSFRSYFVYFGSPRAVVRVLSTENNILTKLLFRLCVDLVQLSIS